MEQLEHYIDGIVRIDWLTTALSAVVILAVTAVVARLVRRFMRKMLHFNEEKNLPSSSIFVNIARGAVWVLGVCVMLSTCYGVDVSAAVTALGIGGIAISLGFQDTISNLIGGLQVSLMRIIKPGDNIEVGSSSGVVKDITWRHTTIRNSKGEEVVIPNSIINKTALVHLPPVNQVKV
ncbi:MAG: mechanosensitive ion channel family protein, partial [Eggerthellaceae bacterium]